MTTLGLTPTSKLMTNQIIWLDDDFTSPYLPDLAPSDLAPSAVRKWLKTQSVEFYSGGICALVKRWEKAVGNAGDYIEK